MRSGTKELQENDIKTKEPKKSELKRKRERGKIRWRNMIFFFCTKKKDREKGEKRKRESRWRNHKRWRKIWRKMRWTQKERRTKNGEK